MPAVAAPCLLARSQPHRRSLLQGEEPHQEGEGEDAGSAIRSYRWGAGGDQQGGRPRFLRGLRLRRISGPLIMKSALNAIVRGLLAFWFVDGALYALKDTVGSILIVVVLGGSLVLGHPLLGAFVAQALDPRTPQQEASLEHLFAERPVARTLFISTTGLALLNAATAAINFLLNLWMVTASFGTGEFNSQVARVNALTRLTLGVPEFVVMGLAIWWVISPCTPGSTPGCRTPAGRAISGNSSKRRRSEDRRVL